MSHNSNDSVYMAENDILDSVCDFYKGTCVLVTGATGFVGKALVEKLLRTCVDIDTIFVLIRSKPGLSLQKRLDNLLESSVFERLREKDPKKLDKVRAVYGDVSKVGLDLDERDKQNLLERIHVVFHCAATIRFTDNLKDSVTLNALGTKTILELCKQIGNLKSFVHVSTAYSNADKHEIQEIVYETPHDPKFIIDYAKTFPDQLIEPIAKQLVGNHPNSYTFSKALAERLLSEYSVTLPIAIVRPSIITASWKEPSPGWTDNVSGLTGIVTECTRGTIRSIYCDRSLIVDLIPVDIVVNTLITSAWHIAAFKSNTVKVYNCTSGQINPITWGTFGKLIVLYARQFPSKYANRYPGFTYRTNKPLHAFLHLVLHCLPACVIDIFRYCVGQKPLMLRLCKKMARATKNGEFFAFHEFKFHSDNVSRLIRDVTSTRDGHLFEMDLRAESGFQWNEYVKTYMLGIRRYILKDDTTSLTKARARLNRLYWYGKISQILAIYGLLKFLMR